MVNPLPNWMHATWLLVAGCAMTIGRLLNGRRWEEMPG